MSPRQTGGRETWRRLLEWNKGQADSERLAAQILRSEGYQSIDPSHPLGGRDGLKDIICKKDGIKFIGASYFPRGQQEYTRIEEKFKNDLGGVKKNSADGIAFVTNQELVLRQREDLTRIAEPIKVDLFHLERIASILDSAKCYGIRLDFLDIEMTKEEQLAFMSTMSQFSNRFDKFMLYISKSDTLRKEWKSLVEAQERPRSPQYVTPISLQIEDPFSPLWDTMGKFFKCSYCGYGYIVKESTDHILRINTMFGTRIVTCPKCGNAEEKQ